MIFQLSFSTAQTQIYVVNNIEDGTNRNKREDSNKLKYVRMRNFLSWGLRSIRYFFFPHMLTMQLTKKQIYYEQIFDY